MKWAIALVLIHLILFGPWFVFLAEKKQIRWLKPLSYFCLFLGPALVVWGIIGYSIKQAKIAEITKAGGTVKTSLSFDAAGSSPKSPPKTPPP